MANQKVDQVIVNAISAWMSQNKLTLLNVASMCGVTPAAVRKWKVVGNKIRENKWVILFPQIKRFIPPELIKEDEAGKEQYISRELDAEALGKVQGIPLFTMEQLSELYPNLQSAKKYGIDLNSPTIPFLPRIPRAFRDMFAVIVGSGCDRVIPEGARLYTSTSMNDLTASSIAIVKTNDGRVVISDVEYDNSIMTLTDRSNGKKLVSGKISDVGRFVSWVFPVISYEVVPLRDGSLPMQQ